MASHPKILFFSFQGRSASTLSARQWWWSRRNTGWWTTSLFCILSWDTWSLKWFWYLDLIVIKVENQVKIALSHIFFHMIHVQKKMYPLYAQFLDGLFLFGGPVLDLMECLLSAPSSHAVVRWWEHSHPYGKSQQCQGGDSYARHRGLVCMLASLSSCVLAPWRVCLCELFIILKSNMNHCLMGRCGIVFPPHPK